MYPKVRSTALCPAPLPMHGDFGERHQPFARIGLGSERLTCSELRWPVFKVQGQAW